MNHVCAGDNGEELNKGIPLSPAASIQARNLACESKWQERAQRLGRSTF